MGEFEPLELSESDAKEAGITNYADLIRYKRTGELTPDAEMIQRQRERDQTKNMRTARLKIADAASERKRSHDEVVDPVQLRTTFAAMLEGVETSAADDTPFEDDTAHTILLAAEEWHDLVEHFRAWHQLGDMLEAKSDETIRRLEERLQQPGLSDAASGNLLEADFQIIDAAQRGAGGLQEELRRRPLEFQARLLERPGKFGDQVVEALTAAGPGKNQLSPEVTAEFATTVLGPLLDRIDSKISDGQTESTNRDNLSGPINTVHTEIKLLRQVVDSVLDNPDALAQAQASGFDRSDAAQRVTDLLLDAPGDFNMHETAQNAVVLIDKLNRPEGYEDPSVDPGRVEEFLSRIYHNLVLPYSSSGFAHKPYQEIHQAIRDLYLDTDNVTKGHGLPR